MDYIIITLTQGAINNGYLRVSRNLDFFPSDAVGGTELAFAGRPFHMDFGGGLEVETDIARDKGILRARGAVHAFIAREGARAGSRVRVERAGPNRYRASITHEVGANSSSSAKPAPRQSAHAIASAVPPGAQEPLQSPAGGAHSDIFTLTGKITRMASTPAPRPRRRTKADRGFSLLSKILAVTLGGLFGLG